MSAHVNYKVSLITFGRRININDIDEEDLYDRFVDPRRKKSSEELRAENSKYSKTEESSGRRPPGDIPPHGYWNGNW